MCESASRLPRYLPARTLPFKLNRYWKCLPGGIVWVCVCESVPLPPYGLHLSELIHQCGALSKGKNLNGIQNWKVKDLKKQCPTDTISCVKFSSTHWHPSALWKFWWKLMLSRLRAYKYQTGSHTLTQPGTISHLPRVWNQIRSLCRAGIWIQKDDLQPLFKVYRHWL